MPRRRGEFEPLPKPKEDLETQVREADETLVDQHVSPISEGEAVFNMTEEELKEKYPKRYQIYLELLRDQRKEASHLDELELEKMSKWLYVLNSVDRYISEHLEAETKDQTLRGKQLTVFEDLRNFLEKGQTEGYIKLPTGTGKTVIFSEFIESLGLKTLVVVPKKILVEQTRKTLSEFTEDLDVGRLYSEAKEHGRQVTIITYQSLISKTKNGEINPADYDLLILDEVHKALSYYRSQAVKQFEDAIKIGFTATHKFSEKKKVSDLLGTEIHNMSICEAVEEKMLCPYSVMIVETDTDITQVPVMTTGDYNPEELEKAINISGRNKEAVEIVQKVFKGQKGIAYCQGVKHAMDLSEAFKNAGIAAEVIYGEQNIRQQMELKRKFESGEIQVLCNSDILIEGFDEPTASVCLNLRPTLSPVVAEQRGGRVLRLDPKNPNKQATIVDFIDKTTNRKNIQYSFVEVSRGAFVTGKKDAQAPIVDVKDIDPAIKIISDPKVVFDYAQKMIERRKELAPIGWLTSSGTASIANIRVMVIEYLANKHREAHPEWFDTYKAETKQYREFYSPQLVDLIAEEVKAKEPAPHDWRSVMDLSHEVNRSYNSVKRAINILSESHPEWFKKYFSPAGFVDDYFAPELCEKVRDFFTSRRV
jgi:superfamily II DNA or RNA helicase